MAERDLTDEQFVDLAVTLVHVLFDPEPPDRQRLRRVHGRLRPRAENPVGEPHISDRTPDRLRRPFEPER